MASHGLIDSWRERNPDTRQFSHYSAPHKLSSRIDHIFLTPTFLPSLRSAKMYNISWSDHCPICITLSANFEHPGPRVWRLNEALLSRPAVVKEVKESLINYFKEKLNTVALPVTLWEAHKPVIRGIFMQQGSRIKKARVTAINALSQELDRLIPVQNESPGSDYSSQIRQLRKELDLLLTSFNTRGEC